MENVVATCQNTRWAEVEPPLVVLFKPTMAQRLFFVCFKGFLDVIATKSKEQWWSLLVFDACICINYGAVI